MKIFPVLERSRKAVARSISALLIPLILTAPAGAATFQFDFGGPMGTFEAPLGGGIITAFNVTIGDTTFDTPGAGPTQPVYNPILNTFNGLIDVEFTGVGASDGAIFNSAPSASCPLGACVLQLFDTSGGTAAPEWAVQNLVMMTNVAFGFYSIDPEPVGPAPVPLPAALPLLLAALTALGLIGTRRKRTVVAAA